MAKFTINCDAELTAAEVIHLQEVFKNLEVKIAATKVLEKAAQEYFDNLYSIGEEMGELHKYSEDFTVDGREVWVDPDNYYNAARSVARFWIPSSMSC